MIKKQIINLSFLYVSCCKFTKKRYFIALYFLQFSQKVTFLLQNMKQHHKTIVFSNKYFIFLCKLVIIYYICKQKPETIILLLIFTTYFFN